MNTTDHHDTTAALVLAAFVGLAGLGALLDALLDATGHPVLVALALAGLALLVGLLRWVVRVLRERREDRADALAGAAWRARHLPATTVPAAAGQQARALREVA